ncbi:MAG: biopolymer transporter ExbD [Planctomycetaceae bacterium]|nr:biopolymer transporter ExbD [Planctomycetaceae bacterium]
MGRLRNVGDDDRIEASIEMSPLIDCVFILLIFFIVTTTFVEETGVDVRKPRASTAQALEKDSMLIALTADGEVRYGGREIGVGGVRREVTRILAGDPEIPVVIQADKDSRTELLVRIVDEAQLADARRISVATAND